MKRIVIADLTAHTPAGWEQRRLPSFKGDVAMSKAEIIRSDRFALTHASRPHLNQEI